MIPRTKIAVLGGGVGAMSAAYSLTATPELRDRYDVTIYQMGWRLGGKGASGRNAAYGQRIEEHGLHIWMGWYQNAFRVMRECYAEWEPSPGCPFAYWTDAFEPQNHITLMEQVHGEWKPWQVEFPPNPELPGEGPVSDSIWDYLVMLIDWLRTEQQQLTLPPEAAPATGFAGFVTEVVCAIEAPFQPHPQGHPALEHARPIARALSEANPADANSHTNALSWCLREFKRYLADKLSQYLDTHDDLRRFFILADLGCTVGLGLLEEGIHSLADFSRLDSQDLREWLAAHGAFPIVVNSPMVQSFYDLAFAYLGGETSCPSAAAGASLQALMRMALGYKGAVLWKMQAGMGDTVFTPFYEVLKARGVRFEFFTRVKRLVPGPGNTIAAIEVARQATLKPEVESAGGYRPLVMVNGLRCWPSVPQYDQLVEGEQLRAQKINLESWWTPWQDPAEETLTLGTDFDQVVLGISLGALPELCADLVAANAGWKAMVEGIPTVQTQSFQLWMSPNVRGLGAPAPHTVLTTYVEPFATWGDMSHLTPRESWPQEAYPGSVAYFCGPLPNPRVIPPPSDHGFPAEEAGAVKEGARTWLEANAARIWPGGVPAVGEFDWSLLVDPYGGEGAARFDAQYFRANIDPTERYVLSPPHSTVLRMEPGASGFVNLFPAGDWVWTSVNGGCVESAVIGGLLAAQAICGEPKEIPGYYPKSP